MSGTFGVSRDIWDDPIFADEPYTQREAWLWLMSEASFKARTRRVSTAVVSLKRGELAASVRFIARAWKWSLAKVQRYLSKLKKLNMVDVKTDTGVSIVTVCNYDVFQGKTTATDTAPIQDRYKREEGGKKGVIKEDEAKASLSVSQPEAVLQSTFDLQAPSDPDIQAPPPQPALPSPPAPQPANDQSQAVTAYNAAAKAAGWPQVQKLTLTRSRQLKARLAECGGPEGWEVALQKAFASDFCRGHSAKPWHGFSFDWMVKSANFTKLMEGNYDNRACNTGSQEFGSGGYGSGTVAAFAEVARRRAARAA